MTNLPRIGAQFRIGDTYIEKWEREHPGMKQKYTADTVFEVYDIDKGYVRMNKIGHKWHRLSVKIEDLIYLGKVRD